MKDTRKNSRVEFRAVVHLDFPNRSHADCETRDLSIKGVFVIGVTGHAVGEHCAIFLRLVGSTRLATVAIKGRIVRVDPDGIALHFDEMDLDSFSHLKNIIYFGFLC